MAGQLEAEVGQSHEKGGRMKKKKRYWTAKEKLRAIMYVDFQEKG